MQVLILELVWVSLKVADGQIPPKGDRETRPRKTRIENAALIWVWSYLPPQAD